MKNGLINQILLSYNNIYQSTVSQNYYVKNNESQEIIKIKYLQLINEISEFNKLIYVNSVRRVKREIRKMRTKYLQPLFIYVLKKGIKGDVTLSCKGQEVVTLTFFPSSVQRVCVCVLCRTIK